jgi:hypothetical protein
MLDPGTTVQAERKTASAQIAKITLPEITINFTENTPDAKRQP